MNSNRKAAIIAGVLFIIGTVAGILSVAPTIDDPDYLIKASANANQVIIGAFFQFVIATAYVGIAILLYPILRRYNESLALGFLSFRIIAAVWATLLVMFRLIEIITPIYIVLAIPWALQEMVLAVWLIVKGFNPSAVAFS